MWWSKCHDLHQGEGKRAQHFHAGCNLFTVPIIQTVHSEEYIQVCTKIYQSTKETTKRKIKMKTVFTITHRIHNIQKWGFAWGTTVTLSLTWLTSNYVWVWPVPLPQQWQTGVLSHYLPPLQAEYRPETWTGNRQLYLVFQVCAGP